MPTIHFHKQLVQSVFSLALAAEVPTVSFPADCIDLIDEKDARGNLASYAKHIPYLLHKQ